MICGHKTNRHSCLLSLNCVRLSLRQQKLAWWASVLYNQQPGHIHAADCQPTALVSSVLLVQSAGTLYRTT